MARKYEAVGIDLGTTYSALAYIDEHAQPRVVHNPEDQRPILPSAVFFDGDDVIVGETALANACVYPDRVAQLMKRDIGEKKSYASLRNGKEYTPESVSALILKKLIAYSEPSIGEIKKAVITVPAFFDEKRRMATEHAGKIAGLEVTGILNEPSAALVAHGLHHSAQDKFYVVYDLGGGTFDVTVMRVGGNVMQELATGGNRKLGGCDFDEALVTFVADEFVRECGADPREDAISYQSLVSDCRQAKRRLSDLGRTTIRCMHAGKSHQVEVTRDKFEKLTRRILSKTEMTIEACIQDAGLDWSRIDGVMLVGGATLMPMVKKMVERISGKSPMGGVDPQLAVCTGAAMYAGILEMKARGKVAMSAGPTGDDERVPLDASSDAGGDVVGDDGDDLEPVDLHLVNSHGIGVYARKGERRVNVVMIPKNSKLPVAQTRLFRTTKENMSQLTITISEGDTEHLEASEVLGTCVLGPLPDKLAKGEQIELQLGYSKEGRVSVSAVCKSNGLKVDHELEAEGILSEQEVESERQEMAETTVL